MLERIAWGLALATATLWARPGCADEILSYLNLSSQDKLRSQVGLLIGGDRASLNANLTLEGADDPLRVSPSVTSAAATGTRLDLGSPLGHGDWDATTVSATNLSTRISLRSELAAIDRIEGTLQQTARDVSQSLRFGFADFGIRALGGAPVNVRTSLTLRSGGASAAPSSVSSAVSFGSAVDLATVWQFAADGFDTKLTYRTDNTVVEQVVAGLRRRPNGELAQSIGVRFPGVARSREIGPDFKLTSGATLEETLAPDGLETVRMGLETSIVGLRSPLVGGTSKLSVKLERPLDEAHTERTSLAYDHAWAPRDETSIALNLKMLREAGELEPTLGVSWRSRF